MNTNTKDFFGILREVKINNIIGDYQEKYNDSYNNLEKLKTEILKNDKNIYTEIQNGNCNIKNKKILPILFKKYLSSNSNEIQEYFEELMDLIFDIIIYNQNETYNKIRKHKMLYFLYGLIIFYKNLTLENIDIEQDDYNFFVKKEIEWCAFAKGPVINTFYKFGDYDELIQIDWSKLELDSKELDVFKTGILAIEKFSTEMLIEESHKTYPWLHNYELGVNFKVIPLNEIIDYFKNIPPFFVGTNN